MWLRYLFCLCLSVLAGGAVAQEVVWESKVPQKGELGGEWLGNRGHFFADAGRIALQAPEGGHSSFIYTSVRLPKECTWQGQIRFFALPSKLNYTYLVLAKLMSQAGQMTCLALSFGGSENAVHLAEVTFRLVGAHWQHDIRQDKSLIKTNILPPYLLRGMSYQVIKTEDGRVALYLSQEDEQHLSLIDEIEYTSDIQADNLFAIYSAYTSGRRQGVYISELRLLDYVHIDESDKPIDQGESNKPTEHIDDDAMFLLSEIMANPLQDSPEYIELYHNGSISASLVDYSLGIGANKSQIRRYNLHRLTQHLEPGGYYVLTDKPDELKASYPYADRERMITFNLPRLRNAGFVLQLYFRGRLIDEVEYSPEKFGRALRNRRGVALERNSFAKSGAGWLAARAEMNYASPTSANTQEGFASDSGVQTNLTGRLSRIISLLEQDFKLRAYVQLCDFMGNILISIPHKDSLRELRAIQEQPYEALYRLGDNRLSGILLVRLYDAKDNVELYSLKYSLR